jgi:hypothetical protein
MPPLWRESGPDATGAGRPIPRLDTRMLRRLKAANAKERSSWRGKAGAATANRDVGPAATISLHRESAPAAGRGLAGSRRASSALKEISKAPAEADVLSGRAENVLKCLAADLTGEDPPKGRWTPSPSLLRKIGYSDLQVARNCGPQTVDEIVRWARSQGVVIERPFHAGKSLSTMWRDVVASSLAGEFTTAEIAEALERSIRRKNARIPVPVQGLLLDLLKQAGGK